MNAVPEIASASREVHRGVDQDASSRSANLLAGLGEITLSAGRSVQSATPAVTASIGSGKAAAYMDRIIRGTKPSELPVQLPISRLLASADAVIGRTNREHRNKSVVRQWRTP